jgi:hypothetical protein
MTAFAVQKALKAAASQLAAAAPGLEQVGSLPHPFVA